MALAGFGASSASAAFTQCPAVGQDTSCAFLVTVNSNGSVTVSQDSSQGPYDGSDDTLVGFQNGSSKSVKSVNISSSQTIFAFETGSAQDGPCNPSQWPAGAGPHGAAPGCPGPQGFGPTGYEGPNNTFTNINSSSTAGTVSFKTAIAPGGSTWWTLEEALNAGQLSASAPGDSVPPKLHSNAPKCSTNGRITLSATDKETNGTGVADIAWRIDRGKVHTVKKNHVTITVPRGTHHVIFAAADKAGNVSKARTITVKVGGCAARAPHRKPSPRFTG